MHPKIGLEAWDAKSVVWSSSTTTTPLAYFDGFAKMRAAADSGLIFFSTTGWIFTQQRIRSHRIEIGASVLIELAAA
jgi:hypothetical protein